MKIIKIYLIIYQELYSLKKVKQAPIIFAVHA